MRKLVNGIVEFRRNLKPEQRDLFARLALGQKPDALFIACSDSRVAPNVFASTDPGDLFVTRNVGNLVPPSNGQGLSVGDESEIAAIEFALSNLQVGDIIVCGHSECGAMAAIMDGRAKVAPPHLRSWLRHAESAMERLEQGHSCDHTLARHNQLSQLNVLLQLEHLQTYEIVVRAMREGKLRLHGWWFDIAQGEVNFYDPNRGRFGVIDETSAAHIFKLMGIKAKGPASSCSYLSCEV